jgi:hypothetical protein
MYLVCQTPKCQQTYPLEEFEPEAKNVSCKKCGGVVVDGDGRANLSQNPHVIPIITVEEMEQNRKAKLERKRKEMARLQAEVTELEQGVQSV